MGKLTALKPSIPALSARLLPAPKKPDPFYLSPEWRSLIAEIKYERGNFCQDCGNGGRKVRMIGDHVIEIKDGGALLDKNNVRLLCMACHNRKTQRARGHRARGMA